MDVCGNELVHRLMKHFDPLTYVHRSIDSEGSNQPWAGKRSSRTFWDI